MIHDANVRYTAARKRILNAVRGNDRRSELERRISLHSLQIQHCHSLEDQLLNLMKMALSNLQSLRAEIRVCYNLPRNQRDNRVIQNYAVLIGRADQELDLIITQRKKLRSTLATSRERRKILFIQLEQLGTEDEIEASVPPVRI